MSQQTRVRRLAVLAAGAVASTSLAVVAVGLTTAPAGAALATGSFNWEISQQYDNHLSEHILSGVTENTDGVISFPAVSSSIDPSTGAGTVQYDGSVQAGFTNGGATAFYWVKLEDPAVTVDTAGEGQITALVSSAVGGFDTAATAARVVVTTFDAAGKWGTGSIAATPDWAGVTPAGSAAAASYNPSNASYPVDGKSFAATFVTQLVQSVRAHFYYTTGSELKAPSAFTASYAVAPVAVTTATTYANQTATVKVDGSGFTGTDGNPGDDGVYVGIAPAGGLPDVSSQASMSKFVASQWVPGASVQDNKISTTLTVPSTKLDPATSYAVYTWRAHGHSSTSQDSQTAITFDWAQLTAPPAAPVAAATKATAKVTKKLTTKKKGSLAVAITSADATPSGKVTVALTKKGAKTVKRSATLKNGKATVKLPKLEAGTWKATVTYAGSDAFEEVIKVVTFKVEKAKKSKKAKKNKKK